MQFAVRVPPFLFPGGDQPLPGVPQVPHNCQAVRGSTGLTGQIGQQLPFRRAKAHAGRGGSHHGEPARTGPSQHPDRAGSAMPSSGRTASTTGANASPLPTPSPTAPVAARLADLDDPGR